jgi:hypothetical protein
MQGSCQPAPENPSPPASENSCYRNHLQAIADLAPTLKEAELRVLLAMTADAAKTGQQSTRISLRQLAKACGRTNSAAATTRACAALIARGLVAQRKGTATTASAYLLNFLGTLTMPQAPGVPVTGGVAPRTTPLPKGGVPPTTPLLLFGQHPVLFGTTPPPENKGLSGKPASVDIEGLITFEGLIDRLSRANFKTVDPKTLDEARAFMHGYRAKMGTPQPAEPWPPHPPDNRLIAQFLATGDGVGGWPALQRMLYTLMHEKKAPGRSYAWFISVAAQRLHGIDPRKLAEKRQQLRLLKAANQPPNEHKANDEIKAANKSAAEATTHELIQEAIAAAAAAKRLA